MNRDFLSVQEVLEIHDEQIERYGGSYGVRDPGGLESAVSRPQSGYYDGVISEAAALWESLSQNHPFVDGNKRTAFAATYTFLALNDVKIMANSDQTYEFISGAFERQEMNFSTLETWLSANTQERSNTKFELVGERKAGVEARVSAALDRSDSGEHLDRVSEKTNDRDGEQER